MIPASVAIIALNAEEDIRRAIQSVRAFQDIVVVVDERSTDGTAQAARELGARVYVEPWRGYGPQKQSALRKCRYPWVLMLDADERVPEETLKSIARVLEDPRHDAYSLPRKNYLRNRWIRHAGFWPDRVVRLVRKERGSLIGKTHERWHCQGSVGRLDAPLEHYSFKDYADMLRRLDAYSSALAQEMFEAGRKASALEPLLHGLGMFIKVYFLRLGFLEGLDGLVIALTKAGGAFFKYAKLLELWRLRGHSG